MIDESKEARFDVIDRNSMGSERNGCVGKEPEEKQRQTVLI